MKSGDVLFHQWDSLNEWNPTLVTIGKVGRKWATLVDGWSDTRVDIETLQLNGRRAWGRLWRTQQEWAEAKEADRKRIEDDLAWDGLRRGLHGAWRRPTDLHADAIRQAATLLGIDLRDML